MPYIIIYAQCSHTHTAQKIIIWFLLLLLLFAYHFFSVQIFASLIFLFDRRLKTWGKKILCGRQLMWKKMNYNKSKLKTTRQKCNALTYLQLNIRHTHTHRQETPAINYSAPSSNYSLPIWILNGFFLARLLSIQYTSSYERYETRYSFIREWCVPFAQENLYIFTYIRLPLYLHSKNKHTSFLVHSSETAQHTRLEHWKFARKTMVIMVLCTVCFCQRVSLFSWIVSYLCMKLIFHLN